MSYLSLLPTDRWQPDGQCTCGGVLTLTYRYIADRSITLKVKPARAKCSLYSRTWSYWDRPLTDLATLLTERNL